MNRHIFLTGVTGFVGRNLLAHLHRTNPADKFSVLVRAQSQTAAENRYREILKSMSDEIDMVRALKCREVLAGDVTVPQFGLDSHQNDTGDSPEI